MLVSSLILSVARQLPTSHNVGLDEHEKQVFWLRGHPTHLTFPSRNWIVAFLRLSSLVTAGLYRAGFTPVFLFSISFRQRHSSCFEHNMWCSDSKNSTMNRLPTIPSQLHLFAGRGGELDGLGFGLRAASGESGAEGGEKRLAERSRSATPPPSRRRKPPLFAATLPMPLVTSARFA